MNDLTREQWLKGAAETAKALQEEGGDLADLASDIPKALRVFARFKSVVDEVKAVVDRPQPVPEPQPSSAVAPLPMAVPKPPAAPVKPAAKVSKPEMVQIAQSGGLTPQERAMFDRASSLSG